MSASCARAQMLATKLGRPEAIQLADVFCTGARDRIAQHFRELYGPNDDKNYQLALSVLKGEHAWLESGIVDEYTADVGVVARPVAQKREPAGVA